MWFNIKSRVLKEACTWFIWMEGNVNQFPVRKIPTQPMAVSYCYVTCQVSSSRHYNIHQRIQKKLAALQEYRSLHLVKLNLAGQEQGIGIFVLQERNHQEPQCAAILNHVQGEHVTETVVGQALALSPGTTFQGCTYSHCKRTCISKTNYCNKSQRA